MSGNRFNNYLLNHFNGCRLLHQGIDPHRNRASMYYAIPGDFTIVGYSDGTDAFIIPASGYLPTPVTQALQRLLNGEDFKYTPTVKPRARINVEIPAAVKPRVRVQIAAPVTPRQRIMIKA